MTTPTPAFLVEDEEESPFSHYAELTTIQGKLERFIDRAKYHGEHTQALPVFEEMLEHIEAMLEHEEREF